MGRALFRKRVAMKAGFQWPAFPRLVQVCAVALLTVGSAPLLGETPPQRPAQGGPSHSTQAFFSSPDLPCFEIEVGRQGYQQLARSPRQYVSGRVVVCGRTFHDVGVRLKGGGTFQSVSLRPNLALKFNWRVPGQDFEGLTKLYLNNSRQDPSLLCELIASTAFASAGVAVPHVTHARVRLNGRDLGLCVLAEAVNKRFLNEHFTDGDGPLYEGAFQDIRSGLEQDNGARGDRAALHQLTAALALPDRTERREAVAQLVDREGFLNFLAVEMIVANWDGYALHQNNYRIYHPSKAGRWSFIPHGVDNSIFESGLSLMPPRKSALVSLWLATEADRASFRQRVAALLPLVFDPAKLRKRVDFAVAKMSQGATPLEADALARRAAYFAQCLEARSRNLRAQLDGQRPETPDFDEFGVARLEGWIAKPDWNGSAVEQAHTNGTFLLSIRATNGFCFGSWRLPTWLPAGRYRIEGSTATSHVQGLSSMTGSGAGVRALGTRRGSGVEGSQDWTPVQQEFRVQAGCEWVELIAELRAYRGQALFDPAELRLIRVQP